MTTALLKASALEGPFKMLLVWMGTRQENGSAGQGYDVLCSLLTWLLHIPQVAPFHFTTTLFLLSRLVSCAKQLLLACDSGLLDFGQFPHSNPLAQAQAQDSHHPVGRRGVRADLTQLAGRRAVAMERWLRKQHALNTPGSPLATLRNGERHRYRAI